MKRRISIVNKAILAMPTTGTCDLCTAKEFLTHSAWITDGWRMRKLYVCTGCAGSLDRILSSIS